MTSFACQWDWCGSAFISLDALRTHVKHEHIWPMEPMRRSEIALMRRLDLASLHSTGISSASPPRSTPTTVTTGPRADHRPENGTFDTFTQLSSPSRTPPQSLPVSPAFESLVRQDGFSRLSAAVGIFERHHGHNALSSQLSPGDRPLSGCSVSSQEVVEQQLTQDEVAAVSSDLQIDNELTDAELAWPTEDELATQETPILKQPTQGSRSSSSSPIKGQSFRCGSLHVPLSCGDSQESNASSQPFVLQTQAPYTSQPASWSQTQ